MATITRRGKSWSVQIRRKGHPTQFRSFGSKKAAEAWCRDIEGNIARNQPTNDLKALRRLTLGDIIRRYIAEITPRKRSHESEKLRLEKLLRDPISDRTLDELGLPCFAAYRDRRLECVRPGTARRELSLLHHSLEVARLEWRVGLAVNPVQGLELPKLRNARDRRLRQGELERLMEALRYTRNGFVKPIVLLAIETGMRRSEILGLRCEEIDLEKGLARILWSKTGAGRTTPLTPKASQILSERIGERQAGLVFPIGVQALRLAWERLRRRAKLPDLRFHDLRHEAVSRFFELGLSLPEVAVISGHRDARMLLRYTHLRPTDVADRLKRLITGRGDGGYGTMAVNT